ncbi:MmcB family DNA repair protein [Agrobacterium vitis]|uniref:MmcB family DNA repair protein n=1 Tax=Agrobacterium vitis TaxID=373 RepID=UPI001F444C2B|nr:MmcB family DNA repair protein [Agrobacterium vitis]MCF1452256.1 MmcB family DNA repair protein [Agrobacterium vitis]
MTAAEILEILIAGCDDTMIWASELALSNGARRCDFWTIAPWPSKGYLATAYEIKISRADFKRDTHGKQREARLFSDRFYYVTPAGLLKPEEIPDWAGLIEITEGKQKTIVQAPLRDKDAPSWELIVSLLRNSGRIRRDADLVKKERDILRAKVKRASEQIRAAGKQPWQFGL